MASGRPPAVVIIARHGARLDAAEKQWHLTSATPYDPPLTYGGWLQARALGTRIARELHELGASQQSRAAASRQGHVEPEPTRKRRKIIIHSSPFLRCLQTGIGISAGLSQSGLLSTTDTVVSQASAPTEPQQLPSNTDSLTSATTASGLHADQSSHSTALPTGKATELRIDAFLGEWLSPEYFENITAPPNSVMMVANAKAELMRPGVDVADLSSGKTSLGHFPGGWSRERSSASAIQGSNQTELLPLPKRTHTVGHGTRSQTTVHCHAVTSLDAQEPMVYSAPTPSYAISLADPIPAGYVHHAQDACVDVKYQWDSMRPPQDWGNGGYYGEEWSGMHKRFRSGLQRLIAWYQDHGATIRGDEKLQAENETDRDIVVILVTHGAGCNALIGALTNQPVLIDVGMASLTMAVRKERSRSASTTLNRSPTTARRGSIDFGVADAYDMRLTASVEHLRGSSATSALPSLKFPSFDASRRPSGALMEEAEASADASAIRATPEQTNSSYAGRSLPTSSFLRPSSRLWQSSTTNSREDSRSTSDSESLPKFDAFTARESSQRPPSESTESASDSGQKGAAGIWKPEIIRTNSQRGLWAGSSSVREDRTPKRRWTAADS